MAIIRPFTGLRYAPAAGRLDDLAAPPYDVLTADERNALAAKSPHNVVHLTLPEQLDDDRSKFVKYARSAARLAEWRREGVLSPEPKPAIYRYVQTFDAPGFSAPLVRTSFIALLKTEPYSKGVVLPHEQTFPKHKEDRLRILEATRAHLECIFGLFEDPGAIVLEALKAAAPAAKVNRKAEGGLQESLEPITDPETCTNLVKLLADKKVWIADGHHRYETACTFRENLGPREGEVAEDYMMMAFSSMSDPGLVLLPTHRILQSGTLGIEAIVAELGRFFDVEEVRPEGLYTRLEQKGLGVGAFGVALPGGKALLLTPTNRKALVEATGEPDALLRELDVTVLHRVILEKLLGVEGLGSIGYTRDPDEALRAPNEGAAASFIMNPPTIEDMRKIALAGGKMPQKSTYYYPKIQSGLVLWSLNDF